MEADVSRQFVKQESVRGRQTAIQVNWRLLASLPLFQKVFPLSFLLIITSSLAPSLFRWYVGEFANGSDFSRIPSLEWGFSIGLAGIGWLALAATLLRIGAWISFEISGMWSAQGLHARMSRALGATRTTFFDENPSGRLINRLVRDYDEVRSTAVIFIGDVLNAGIEVISVSILALVVSPWVALAVLPLFGVLTIVQWFRTGMIDHARSLSAVATSRVLDRKTDLIEGREIFLIYGKTQRLLNRMAAGYEHYVRASVLGSRLETWASFWVNIAAETFAGLVLFALVVEYSHGRIDLTFAGVVISALFGIRGSVGWLDYASSLIGRAVPHVRRVFEFIDLPREQDEEMESPAVRSFSVVPKMGDIEFRDYTMSYRKDSPPVLEELSLVLPLGSKTALIGRTGSGKTSVIQALFRMVYVRSGDLCVDGVSAFQMDLTQLRRLFGVVPQFPYLFAGSLRANLDRAFELSDEKLLGALKTVGLTRLKLEDAVEEGGANFSMGERQLLCLARVIAADRPCIIMDEPTSGLDPETDARIQRVLETALAGKTLLTIAHRRESLGRYDRVIEMSRGRVIWQGTPGELAAR